MKLRTFVFLATAALAAVSHADLNYSNFSSTAGLTLNGTAHSTTGGALRLTDLANWQNGSFWASTPQTVTGGFDTTFTYHIGEGSGADGFTFAIQDHSATQLGGDGGSLGFNGIASVFGVQFRTYDHNKIQIGGNTDTPVASVNNANLRGDHTVRIIYVPGTMSVYWDGTLATSGAVDLGAMYGNANTYVGFTGATGGTYDIHEIGGWTFKSGAPQAVPEPGTMAALGLGALGLLKRRRKA